MSELLMTYVKAKFANAREACPGMSEDVYALTDYFAEVANDQLTPAGVTMVLLCIMDDLKKKRCGFGRQVEFPAHLAQRALQVRAEMPYFLQVLDAVAERGFADEVRAECREAFNWDVPKRVTTTDKISSRDNINAAVDWWSEAIQHPKMDNGTNEMSMAMMLFGGMHRRQLTADDLRTFREKLAEGIVQRMVREGHRITLDVDYGPDRTLGEAGAAIGLGQFDFPCKTTMWVSDTEVRVSAGYGAPPPRLFGRLLPLRPTTLRRNKANDLPALFERAFLLV